MMWEMGVAIAVVGVLLLPYVVGTIAVRFATSFNPNPSMRELDPTADDLPTEVREFGFRIHDEFTRLGFEPGPLLLIEGMLPNLATYAAMYVRREDGQQAMGGLSILNPQGNVRTKPGYVEFSTNFKNGVAVMTNTSVDAPFGPRTPEVVILKAPQSLTVEELLSLHQEAAWRFGGGTAIKDIAPGWALRSMEKSVKRFAERGVRHGYLRERPDGKLGMTWKGALIGAVTNLPPWSLVARARVERPARELMRVMYRGE